MRRIIFLSAALIMIVTGAASGQGRPDFSGTWKFAKSNPPDYPGSAGWGIPSPTVVIRQSATELTIESGQFGSQVMKVMYKLDGTDTIWDAPSTTQSGSTTVVKWRTKAKWDGSKLILYTWNTALNQLRDIFTLSGGALTVDRATEQPGPSTNAMLTYTK